MLAFLISLAPYLPPILSLVSYLFEIFGASKDNLKAYQDMVQQNKDAGLISVATYQKLSDYHRQMLQDYVDKYQKEADDHAALLKAQADRQAKS